MAIAEATGTYYGSFTSTASSGSSDITVPADADILIVYVTGYKQLNAFTGGSLTIEGDATVEVNADAGNSFQGAAFYKLAPTTGAGVTIAWNWGWGSTADNGVLFVWVAYTGVGSVRGTYGDQEGSGPYETTQLTASDGDWVSIFPFGYVGSDSTYSGWATTSGSIAEVVEFTAYANADGALGVCKPTGNVTISGVICVDNQDGGILAVVLTPAAGGATSYPRAVSGTMVAAAGGLVRKFSGKRKQVGIL